MPLSPTDGPDVHPGTTSDMDVVLARLDDEQTSRSLPQIYVDRETVWSLSNTVPTQIMTSTAQTKNLLHAVDSSKNN